MQSTSRFNPPRLGTLGTDRIEIERIRPSLVLSSILAVATFLAVVVADPFAPGLLPGATPAAGNGGLGGVRTP